MLSDLSAMTGRAQKLMRTTRRSRIPLSHTLRTRCLASSRAGNVNVSWLAIPAGHRYRYRRVTTTTAGLQHRTVGWHRTSTVRRAVDLFFPAFLVVFTSYTITPKTRDATVQARAWGRGRGGGGPSDRVAPYAYSTYSRAFSQFELGDRRPSRGQKRFDASSSQRELPSRSPSVLCALLSTRFSVCGPSKLAATGPDWTSSGSAAVARKLSRKRGRCALQRRVRLAEPSYVRPYRTLSTTTPLRATEATAHNQQRWEPRRATDTVTSGAATQQRGGGTGGT